MFVETMAFRIRMLMLLCFFLAVTAELGAACAGGRRDAREAGRGEGEEEDKAERLPRSVVVVVTPLGRGEQRLMGAAMPSRRRLAACGKEVYPRWISARRECDCPMAVDHTLRQLARWAREAHGMPTAVISSLNPTNATSEPIVLTMSLPEENNAANFPRSNIDLMQSESDFLETKTGKRKLLWNSFSSKGEDDIDNEIYSIRDEDNIIDSTESKLNEKSSSSKSSPDSKNFSPFLSTENHNFMEWAKDTFELSPEKMDESHTHVEETTTPEEKTSTIQNEMMHQGDHTPHERKCSHGKCESCCGAVNDIGTHSSTEGKKLSIGHPEADPEDLDGLRISSGELQQSRFRQWLDAVEPSLTVLSRFRLGLPLEQPLQPMGGPPFEMGALDEQPHLHVGLQLVEAHPTENVLLAATRHALRTLDATSAHGPGSLFIVRSLAPVSAADLASLLGALGVPLADGAQPSEVSPQPAEEEEGEAGSSSGGGGGLPGEKQLARDRLVVALDACPNLFDDGLELFAHGPKAEDLERITTLENFNQAIQNILSSTTTSRGGGPDAGEELPAVVEVPRGREGFPFMRLHVRRVRRVPCFGRFCIQPLLQPHRHPTQDNSLRGTRQEVSSKAPTVSASTPVTPTAKNRHAAGDFGEVQPRMLRLRRDALLTSPHEHSADVTNPDETNKETTADKMIKEKQGPLLVKKLTDVTTQYEVKELGKKLEVAIKDLSKAINATNKPEKHSSEFKEKSMEVTESLVPKKQLNKEKKNINKDIAQVEEKNENRTFANITNNQTTKNITSTEQTLREQAGTVSTIEERNATLEDAASVVSPTSVAARQLKPEDLLRAAEKHGVKDASLKAARGNTPANASPVAAIVFAPLLLVLAH